MSLLHSSSIEDRAARLLPQMTLEEKIGQLVQFSHGLATGPDNVAVDQRELAACGSIGAILNLTGAEATNDLQRQAVEYSRLGIPILFGQDIIHGYRTVYPVPLGLSAAWNPTLVEACARMAAVEGTAAGLRWTFSPMVDIGRDARWGRVLEGSGEDPHLGSVLAAAWVRGYQGSDWTQPTAMLACAKHFVGYGAGEGGREYNSVELSERTLREVYLPPFQAAVESGVGTLMSGFHALDGVPASADPRTLTDILRVEWGFRGFVVSDWNSVGELVPHGVALDGDEAARQALTAGVDMDMQSNLYVTRLAGLVRRGAVPIPVLDEAVKRILRVKFALGLFERPYTEEGRGAAVLLSPDHLALARQAAEASFVLLKNEPVGDAPLLPLTGDETVALVGPLANSQADMLGAWSLNGRPEDVTTLRQSLAERLGDRLIDAGGAATGDFSDTDFSRALAAVDRSDLVLMALGETRDLSGEARSRSRLDLPGRQLELLQAVVATGKPVVLILFSGRPLAIPWAAEHVPAILAAWFPGVQAGPALARTLYGEVNPAGKLTACWPRSVGQAPIYYNTLNTGRPAFGKGPRGEYVTGYVDEFDTPLFPFGWGLSYTRFVYSDPEISTAKASAANLNKQAAIVVTTTVTNLGSRAGSEVAQLYIRQRGGSTARPVRELKGFERITLAPGEARQLRFTLTKKELAGWNRDLQRTVEAGELTVWVAPHAQGGVPAQVMIAP